MVGNSASKLLESTPIELGELAFSISKWYFCNCANNAHFCKSGHIFVKVIVVLEYIKQCNTQSLYLLYIPMDQ